MHKLKKIINSFESQLDKKSKQQYKNRLREGCLVNE